MSLDAILKSLDKVEGNMNNRLTELTDRMFEIEQKGHAHGGEHRPERESIGSLAVKQFDESRSLFEKTKSLRLEIKAAGDPITTTSTRNIQSGGIGFIRGGVLGFQNALRQSQRAGTTALEYSRYTGQQGAAAVQEAEGDAKAAVRPDHSLITQSSITIAGYAKMSRQALDDRPQMGRVIDTTLARSIQTKLDTVLVNGNTTPAFTGFEPLATAYTSLLYTALVDAISEGVAMMQVAGFSPDVVGLNPADWLAVTVAKGTANDHYLSGSYLGALPTEMRGLRVVLSPSVDAGKALLMDTSHSDLLIVDTYNVEVGYVNDDFTKNLVTILGEMRILPTFTTVGSSRLITPKAP